MIRPSACLFSHDQALCLSILALSGSMPSILSLSGLLHVYSRSQACCLSILSLSIRLAACLFSHYQAYCLPILTSWLTAYLFSHAAFLPIYSLALTQAHCLSILTPADSLPTYSHTIRLTAIYSHSIRLTAYVFTHYQARCHLFSQYQAHSLSILTLMTVYLSSHPMPLRLSCTLAHHCIRALSGPLPIYFCTQTIHLSGPTPRYPVPTIRLATARLTT